MGEKLGLYGASDHVVDRQCSYFFNHTFPIRFYTGVVLNSSAKFGPTRHPFNTYLPHYPMQKPLFLLLSAFTLLATTQVASA